MKIKGSCSQILTLLALLAGVACQSAQKPSSSLKPVQAATPPAQSSQAKAPVAAKQATAPRVADRGVTAKPPLPAPADLKPAAPKSDAVADLVANAEKE